MRKTIFYLLILIFSPVLSNAQTVLKGTVKYEMTYNSEQTDQFASFLPKHSVMTTNGTDARVKSLNAKGGTLMEFLTARGEAYLLDKVDKIAYKMPKNEKEVDDKSKVVKTEEFETILNHKCRKYIVEDEKGKKIQTIWATSHYTLSSTFFKYMNMGNNKNANIYQKIEGVPLKMIIGDGSNNVTMKAVDISATVPPESELKLPSDYSVETFNAMVIGKMMMRGN